MKYIATIDTDNFEDFKFFEDATGKFLIVKDVNSSPDEWIALYFVEAESEEK
jgi:hypothetical protein